MIFIKEDGVLTPVNSLIVYGADLTRVTDIDILLNGGYETLTDKVCEKIQTGNYIYIGE